MMRDEMTGNGGTRPVELGCAVACLAEQHHALAGEAIEQCTEARIIKVGEGFDGFGDEAGRHPSLRNARQMGRATIVAHPPPMLPRQPAARTNRSQPFLVEFPLRAACQFEEFLRLVLHADRDDKSAADLQLGFQSRRNSASRQPKL